MEITVCAEAYVARGVQRNASTMLSACEAEELLNHFPSVEFAFAYGSGAIKQGGYEKFSDTTDNSRKSDAPPMLDLIFAVENSTTWHQHNMLRNPSHYTSIIPLTHPWVAYVQDEIPANFWFNAYISIPMKGQQESPSHTPPHTTPVRMIKYGVVTKDNLVKDLTKWTQLYAAGRLHKPVHVLKDNAEVRSAMAINKEQAINTSILLLPETFCELDLYLSIASLSYVGDPRMIIGENPKKVCIVCLIVYSVYSV